MSIRNISICLTLFIFISCNQATAPVDESASLPATVDTAELPSERILSLDITKVVSGAEHIRKANAYFIVRGKDTSGFRCHFSEWKDSALYFVASFSPESSYSQQRKEFVRILAAASSDFNMQSLNTIGIGRLITTGDLDIKITSQFYAIKFNEELNAFLAHSALADDINAILKTYGLKVDKVVTEKQVYLPQQDVFKYSVIETDPKNIPEEMIDAIVYLKLAKI
jgi:hypothetical protein